MAAVKIVMLGITGVGKSKFINYLCGNDVAATSTNSASETTEVAEYFTHRCDTVLRLMDTPGFLDSGGREVAKKTVLASYDKLQEPNCLCVLLNSRTTTYSKDLQEVVEDYKSVFGNAAMQANLIVVLTRWSVDERTMWDREERNESKDVMCKRVYRDFRDFHKITPRHVLFIDSSPGSDAERAIHDAEVDAFIEQAKLLTPVTIKPEHVAPVIKAPPPAVTTPMSVDVENPAPVASTPSAPTYVPVEREYGEFFCWMVFGPITFVIYMFSSTCTRDQKFGSVAGFWFWLMVICFASGTPAGVAFGVIWLIVTVGTMGGYVCTEKDLPDT